MKIAVKRIYEPPARADGYRVLVDRLWPRGVSKASAKVSLWAKALAPSTALRRWYGHDPEKWPEFQRRYARELQHRRAELDALAAKARKQKVTLLFGAKEERLNNAVALRNILERSAR